MAYRKIFFLHLLLLSCMVPFAQTPVTNFTIANPAFNKMFLKGNKLYFTAKFATNATEWYSLNTTTYDTVRVTNNHWRASGSVAFRPPFRFGDNIFSGSSRQTESYHNLEFSRLDLTTETEQWVDLNNTTGSDPLYYSEDPTNGNVYFRAGLVTAGYQFHYWKPSDNTITRLGSSNISIGFSSTCPVAYIGDTLYTAATINGADGLLHMHKTNGGYVFDSVLTKKVYTLVVIKNKIFFAGKNKIAPIDNYNLFVYNPANGGTQQLTSYANTKTDNNLWGFNTVGTDSTLFVNVTFGGATTGDFIALNPLNNSVTTYTGTPSSVRNTFFYPASTGFLYIIQNDGTPRDIYKLKLSDGTTTRLSHKGFSFIEQPFKASNNVLYFEGVTAATGSEVYQFDLATDSVKLVADIFPGTSGAFPVYFTEANGKLFFSAANAGDREIYSYTLPFTTLPVAWQSFTAQKQQNKVLLQWQTGSETNSKNFTVEHSTNGTSFTPIGTLPAAGNSSHRNSYSYVHTQPAKGNNYYRIQQTDIDGKSKLSTVNIVAFAQLQNFTILANPVKNKQLQISSTIRQALAIHSSDGSLLVKTTLQAGINKVDVSGCAKGIYHMKIGEESYSVLIE